MGGGLCDWGLRLGEGRRGSHPAGERGRQAQAQKRPLPLLFHGASPSLGRLFGARSDRIYPFAPFSASLFVIVGVAGATGGGGDRPLAVRAARKGASGFPEGIVSDGGGEPDAVLGEVANPGEDAVGPAGNGNEFNGVVEEDGFMAEGQSVREVA